ncbi:MAG: hypothetical protein ACP5K2_04815 [bacterium]
MYRVKLIGVVLAVCILVSSITPAYADLLVDKRIRLGLDSIIIGYYTDVGSKGEPEALIGLTFLGVGYRRYFHMTGPFYFYGEGGVEVFILPYIEGGIIFAGSLGTEWKMGLQLRLGVEEYTYDSKKKYSFHPELKLALGLGFRF